MGEGAEVAVGAILRRLRAELRLVLLHVVQSLDVAVGHIAKFALLASVPLLVPAEIRRVDAVCAATVDFGVVENAHFVFVRAFLLALLNFEPKQSQMHNGLVLSLAEHLEEIVSRIDARRVADSAQETRLRRHED